MLIVMEEDGKVTVPKFVYLHDRTHGVWGVCVLCKSIIVSI
jgi:hypothetical protein